MTMKEDEKRISVTVTEVLADDDLSVNPANTDNRVEDGVVLSVREIDGLAKKEDDAKGDSKEVTFLEAERRIPRREVKRCVSVSSCCSSRVASWRGLLERNIC